MSTSIHPILRRLERVRARLTEDRLEALVILKAENRAYLTGFTGSAGIAVVLPERRHLLVDFRYVEQARMEAPEFPAVRVTNLVDGLAAFLRDSGAQRVGFEADTVTVAQLRRLEELAAALELEYKMRRLGADGAAFETIVASGPRSALPHGRASDKPIAAGDLVTFDWGAVVQGYHSD